METQKLKYCTRCNENKPTTEFYYANSNKVLRGECRDCYNKSQCVKHLIHRGFLNLRVDYCECCGTVGPTEVDHDHDMNTFRGFVCPSCNRTMGYQRKKFGTIPDILESRPDEIDSIFIKYYKTAMNRAGLTWRSEKK